MKYGLARVSTRDQSLEQQEDALRRNGVRHIEREVVSGTASVSSRPVLRSLLEEMRRDDELHVTSLDRLSRKTTELLAISDELQRRGIVLVSNGKRFDPAVASDHLNFGIFAVMAEYEVNRLRERTRDRLAARRARGESVGGRKRSLTDRQEIAAMHALDAGMTQQQIADRYDVSRTTVRRAIERQRAKRAAANDPAVRHELREMKADLRRAERELDAATAASTGGG